MGVGLDDLENALGFFSRIHLQFDFLSADTSIDVTEKVLRAIIQDRWIAYIVNPHSVKPHCSNDSGDFDRVGSKKKPVERRDLAVNARL